MIENIVSLSNLLLAVLGTTASATATTQVGAVGLAIALIAVLVAVTALVAGAAAWPAADAGAHPLRAIDVSSSLAQSDPDAAGHPRPRAPGSAAPAAA